MNKIVTLDMWMSSAADELNLFVKDFAPIRESLGSSAEQRSTFNSDPRSTHASTIFAVVTFVSSSIHLIGESVVDK